MVDFMTKDEMRLLIEYLSQQGWNDTQIMDLIRYITK